MSSVGRNDPCPCGSGKKYKRCCARKEQDTVRQRVSTQRIYETFDDSVVAVARWMQLDHPDSTEQIGKTFFREIYGVDAGEAMPDRIEAHEQTDALLWNGLDAAIAYWRPNELESPSFSELDGAEAEPLRSTLLSDDGPRLRPEQRECIADLVVSPLRIVRVDEYRPNETLVLRDLANDTAYDYPYPTASFEPDSVFATRVVERQSGGRCMMGFLPIVEQQVDGAVDAVKAYDSEHGKGVLDDARRSAERSLAAELWRAWLWPFTAEGSAALDGDAAAGDEEE